MTLRAADLIAAIVLLLFALAIMITEGQRRSTMYAPVLLMIFTAIVYAAFRLIGLR